MTHQGCPQGRTGKVRHAALVVVLGEDCEDSSMRAARTSALLVAHDYSEALWLANQVAVNRYGTFQWAPRERCIARR